MRNWLVLSGLLLTALALPARASSPVSRWSDGDWWEAQVEHLTLHHGIPRVEWSPSFRLRFQVTRSEQEVRVEVTTIPENRFKERLILRYSPSGELRRRSWSLSTSRTCRRPAGWGSSGPSGARRSR